MVAHAHARTVSNAASSPEPGSDPRVDAFRTRLDEHLKKVSATSEKTSPEETEALLLQWKKLWKEAVRLKLPLGLERVQSKARIVGEQIRRKN